MLDSGTDGPAGPDASPETVPMPGEASDGGALVAALPSAGMASRLAQTAAVRPNTAFDGPEQQQVMKGFPCGVCGVRFAVQKTAARHERLHGRPDGVEAPLPLPPSRFHACTLCSASFPTPSKLKEHAAVHGVVNPGLSCPDCALGPFTTPSSLRRHRATHTDTRDFVCEICGAKFRRRLHMENHGRVHTQERPFACGHPGCGKAFSQAVSLAVHARTHTGEKPYACVTCGATFTQRSSLITHAQRLMHEEPPRRSKRRRFEGRSVRMIIV